MVQGTAVRRLAAREAVAECLHAHSISKTSF